MAFKSSSGLAPSWLESSLGPTKSRDVKSTKGKQTISETSSISGPVKTAPHSICNGIAGRIGKVAGSGSGRTHLGFGAAANGSNLGGSASMNFAPRSSAGQVGSSSSIGTTAASGVYNAPARSSGSVTGGLMGALSDGSVEYTARHQSNRARLGTATAAKTKAFDSAFPTLGAISGGASQTSGAAANKPAWNGRYGSAGSGESSGGLSGGTSAKGKPKLKMVNQPLSRAARVMPPPSAAPGVGVSGGAASNSTTASPPSMLSGGGASGGLRSHITRGNKHTGEAVGGTPKGTETEPIWRNGSATHTESGTKAGTNVDTTPVAKVPAQSRTTTTPKKKATRSITDLGFMDALDVPASKSVSPPIAIKPSSMVRTPAAPVEVPLAGSIEKEEALLRQMGWGIDLDDDGDNDEDGGLTEAEIMAFTEMARVAAHNPKSAMADSAVAAPTIPTPQWLLAAAATSSGDDLAEESSSDDESSDEE